MRNRLPLDLFAPVAVLGAALLPAQAPSQRPAQPPARSGAEPAETLLLQSPTISDQHIVFVHAGDLWVVGHDGGTARRLTSSSGIESSPQLSPDGRTVAFTGSYEGNADVYLLPVDGGTPRRLTWHPGTDSVLDWHPDGQHVIFRSGRHSGSRYQQAFQVSTSGGLPEPLPLPRVHHLSYDNDGSHIAYTPVPDAFRSWKRYRGGRTTPVWIYDVATGIASEIPHEVASDTFPCWVGDRIVFGSDRDGVMNVHAFTPGGHSVEQLTGFREFHVREIDGHGDLWVFEQAGALHLAKAAGTPQRLRIHCPSDSVAALPRWQSVAGQVRAAAIAPNGQRAVFEARGEMISVPREHGSARNLTASPGSHERSPAWSPDGQHIAWFSDAADEYELHVVDHKGRGEPRRFALDRSDRGPAVPAPDQQREIGGFYFDASWSPDGEHILFRDKFNRLAYLTLESGQISAVAQPQGSLGVLDIDTAWSPDSAWIAFTERNPNTAYDRIVLHDVAAGTNHPLTDGFVNAGQPTFSPDGAHLFFTASTDAGPRRFGLDLSTTAARDASSAIYVAVLKRDAENPLARREDEAFVATETTDGDDQSDGESDDESEAGEDEADDDDEQEPTPSIDLDGLDQRILALPLGSGSYRNLIGVKGGLLFLERGASGSALRRFDLAERKASDLLEGVQNVALAAGGKHLMLARGDSVEIGDLQAGNRKTLDLRSARVRIVPAAEWPQVLREVWRIQRDFFYDPNLHGVDWEAMWQRWSPFLDHVRHRADLNMLIAELIGELACGHQYVSGGELPDAPDGVAVGLLGADYEIAADRYRIAKIHEGQNWNPGLRAPLTEPGVDVREGDFILAIDGQPLTAADNIHELLAGRAEQRVELTVSANQDGSEPRTATVVPLRNEGTLRNRSWIERNRRLVDELSGGRLAYVYMPNTAGAGLAAFERDFYSQLDRQGLVLDERYNGGGKVADHVIEVLSRDVRCYWMNREGWVGRTPFGSFDGPKVMVINEMAGSGGDAMPWLFRQAGLGPLVGTRTWGGLVGISGYPPLMDGGSVTAASFGVMDRDGEWAVENVGVAPDHEVLEWPQDCADGRDPQLEKAVELALRALQGHRPRQEPVYTPPARR